MQLKATVKKVQTIALVGACALTLGGCALGIDAARLAAGSRETKTSTTNASAAPADTAPVDAVPADSGTPDAGLTNTDPGPAGGSYLPPLGTYEPATSDLPPFDPCTEIPAEAFAEVGFSEPYTDSYGFEKEGTCSYMGFAASGGSAILNIAVANYTESDNQALGIYEEKGYQLTPNTQVIGFQDPAFLGTDCEFVISTTRGNISFLYDRSQTDLNGDIACDEGFEIIQQLIH